MLLRLRKAARQRKVPVYSIAALATPGLAKVSGTLLCTAPGGEPAVLTALAAGGPPSFSGTAPDFAAWISAAAALGQPGSVILVGERLAEVPGALAAVARLADATGAKLAWVPRRAGERGAIEAGALPGLLPVGRPVISPQARAEVARAWNKATLPTTPGRDTAGILAAAERGDLGALVIAGVDPADLPDPARRWRAGGDAVHRQPGAAGQRGDRPRGRRVPGGRGRREGRNVRELGGPRRDVRRRPSGAGRA